MQCDKCNASLKTTHNKLAQHSARCVQALRTLLSVKVKQGASSSASSAEDTVTRFAGSVRQIDYVTHDHRSAATLQFCTDFALSASNRHLRPGI